MNILPDELVIHIYKYLKPLDKDKLKYKYSVVWCNKCGELLINGDWFLDLNSTFMLYTCSHCLYDNIYFEDDQWSILLDYISNIPDDHRHFAPVANS